MTCAGCPDSECPQDAWHLHVTVLPHWSWSLSDVASALRRDVERHGVKPIVVTNHFRDPTRQPYKELIPTKHIRGTESDASREIFKMGVLLNNSGWRVKRLKIEGSALVVPHGRALYYETHLKNLNLSVSVAPCSTNAKGDHIHTVRRKTEGELYQELHRWRDTYDGIFADYPQPFRIEAAVLDTNPQMDEEWINE